MGIKAGVKISMASLHLRWPAVHTRQNSWSLASVPSKVLFAQGILRLHLKTQVEAGVLVPSIIPALERLRQKVQRFSTLAFFRVHMCERRRTKV
jgi:hypothetical protein